MCSSVFSVLVRLEKWSFTKVIRLPQWFLLLVNFLVGPVIGTGIGVIGTFMHVFPEGCEIPLYLHILALAGIPGCLWLWGVIFNHPDTNAVQRHRIQCPMAGNYLISYGCGHPDCLK